VKLHTEEFGPANGSRIALLHGISGDLTIFEELTERLVQRGRRVIGVDLRGHGRSPRADSYTLAEYTADVVETLGQVDAVAGHSLGARVLLEAAPQLRPQRAIYLDPAWRIPEVFDDKGLHANVGEHEDGTPYSLAELAVANPRYSEANLRRAQATYSRWDSRALFQVGRLDGMDFTVRPPEVPSLVVFGGESPLYDKNFAAALETAGYTVRIQPGAAHSIHLDDVDATMACLEGWV
jgi:pimeloyl-ACP methyl ester carboxylesterase